MLPFVSWTAVNKDPTTKAIVDICIIYELGSDSYFLRVSEPDLDVNEWRKCKELQKRLKDLMSAKAQPGHLNGPPAWVDLEQGCFKFDATIFTRAPDTLGTNVYVKTLGPLQIGDPVMCKEHQQYLESEALVYEVLKNSPHVHIVKYYGCVVKGTQVVGLAIEEHEEDLTIRCKQTDRPLDIDQVVRDVRAALKHLHGLGYCHNDVNPQNIVVSEDDRAVLIDFDACLTEGLPLGKWPLAGYKGEELTTSCKDNDWAKECGGAHRASKSAAVAWHLGTEALNT
ncbi:hypothetical protein I4F81_004085 [Pyropia yezoensis]|uniref:Uncharacterized protein n=1 Tax=Pyropia yezoensis TaxID=2788 RepID=A0ACC3BVK1_PYRYE|nr:hypothetical protein I4F81_004085 [Neopyropia yezoensis]